MKKKYVESGLKEKLKAKYDNRTQDEIEKQKHGKGTTLLFSVLQYTISVIMG